MASYLTATYGTSAVDALALLILAPIVGSFLGVLIMRLPDGRPIMLGRSECAGCGSRLAAVDLVPLLSYAALRGRCRRCQEPIGGFHPIVELAALAVALVVVLTQRDPASLWFGCLLGWVLLALAWIDCTHLRLPDALTLPLLLAGLAASYVLSPDALTDHAAAAALGYGSFRLLAILYRRVRGREGLGQGDAKLLAAAGAWVGLAQLPFVVLGGAGFSLAALALLAARGRRLTGATAMPFGPGLALALWVLWLADGMQGAVTAL